jgi:hypothetical protein
MAAVTIDASVVDGSNGKLHPNPIAPYEITTIITPDAIPSTDNAVILSPLSAGAVGAAVAISAQGSTPLDGPNAVESQDVPTQDLANLATAQNIPAQELASIVDAQNIPTQELATIVNPESVPTQELANIVSPESVPTQELSTLVSSIAVPTQGLPSLAAAQNIPTQELATIVNSVSVPTQELASIVTPETVPTQDLADIVNPVAVPTQELPNLASAQSVPAQELATIVTPESAPAFSAPAVFTANALPSEAPPFPTNHARILYDNLLSTSTVTATAGTNPSYVLIPNTAQRWVFTDGEDIIFTPPANIDLDTVCIGAHSLKNYSIGVNYETTVGGGYTAFAGGKALTNNDAVMFHRSSTVSVARLKISCSGATGVNFVGSIYAGVALQMQRPFYSGYSPGVLSRQADYFSSNTESGNFIGVEVRRRAQQSNADWKNLSNDWYRTYFDPFLVSAETLPFYFAWNLAEHDRDVMYCKNITNISPSYQGQRDLMSVSIPLVGIA